MRTTDYLRLAAAALCCAAWLPSCGGSTEVPPGCTPGEQRVCACPGGGEGVQICNSSGTALGQCTSCPAAGGAGGSSGAHASGGSSGASPVEAGAGGSLYNDAGDDGYDGSADGAAGQGGGAVDPGPACVASEGLQPGAPWPMLGRCANRASRSAVIGPRKLNIAWTLALPSYYSSPVVAADGTIYLVGSPAALHAIHPDGKIAWKYDLNGSTAPTPAIGADGTIYVANGGLRAIGPDGTLEWTTDVPLMMGASPVIGPDGTIYVGATAVSKEGKTKWSVDCNSPGGPASLGPDGSIFVLCDHKLMKLTPEGAVAWYMAVDQTGEVAPVLDGKGNMYFTEYSSLYALDSSGAKVWSFDAANGAPMDMAGIAIGPDGTVLAESGSAIHAVLGGGLKWMFTTSWVFIQSSPIVDPEGYVYAASADNNVYAITPEGNLAWSYLAPDEFRSSPAMGADGTLYVAGQNSTFYAFAP